MTTTKEYFGRPQVEAEDRDEGQMEAAAASQRERPAHLMIWVQRRDETPESRRCLCLIDGSRDTTASGGCSGGGRQRAL